MSDNATAWTTTSIPVKLSGSWQMSQVPQVSCIFKDQGGQARGRLVYYAVRYIPSFKRRAVTPHALGALLSMLQTLTLGSVHPNPPAVEKFGSSVQGSTVPQGNEYSV